MSWTITTKREVTLTEPSDVLCGTGALSMPWWVDLKVYQKGELVSPHGEDFAPAEGDEIHLKHWSEDGEDEPYGKTIFSWGDIVTAYQKVIDSGQYGTSTDSDPFDLFEGAQDELGLCDAIGGDIVLQYVCYGEVVYG